VNHGTVFRTWAADQGVIRDGMYGPSALENATDRDLPEEVGGAQFAEALGGSGHG
jgi:hypothetical protein